MYCVPNMLCFTECVLVDFFFSTPHLIHLHSCSQKIVLVLIFQVLYGISFPEAVVKGYVGCCLEELVKTFHFLHSAL